MKLKLTYYRDGYHGCEIAGGVDDDWRTYLVCDGEYIPRQDYIEPGVWLELSEEALPDLPLHQRRVFAARRVNANGLRTYLVSLHLCLAPINVVLSESRFDRPVVYDDGWPYIDVGAVERFLRRGDAARIRQWARVRDAVSAAIRGNPLLLDVE